MRFTPFTYRSITFIPCYLVFLLAVCTACASSSSSAPPPTLGSRTDTRLQPAIATPIKQNGIPLGTLFYEYKGHTAMVFGVVWSRDGKRIASASLDGTVQVWDAVTGRHVLVYRGHAGPVFTVDWSPDGTRLVSTGYDHTAQIWNATTGHKDLVYR